MINAKANLLNVSIRAVLIAALLAASFLLRSYVGGIFSLILLLPVAAIVIQLIIWGINWVRHEEVSELGMHIVRFWVIVAAVGFAVFTMLSIDYSNQHKRSLYAELEQTALSAGIYFSPVLPEGGVPDLAALNDASAALDALLLNDGNNENRSALVYIYTDSVPEMLGESGFIIIDQNTVACATDSSLLAYTDSIPAVDSGSLYSQECSVGDSSYICAVCPVYSQSGMNTGAVAVFERQSMAGSVFRYATIELFLTVCSLIALFCFLFYGVMQFADIVMRPRRFDHTRVLPFGRESARPVMFFVMLSFGYALFPLFLRNAGDASGTFADFFLARYLPVTVYALGACLGLLIGRFPKTKLLEAPAAAGIIVALICTAAGHFFPQTLYFIPLTAVSGLGLGIAYRIGDRFREHADRIYKVDDYGYLSPCLGCIAGTILGAFAKSSVISLSLQCALLILTAVITLMMLRNTDVSDFSDEPKAHTPRGSMLAVLPTAVSCAYLWVYVTYELCFVREVSVLAAAGCAAAPFIAFCIGSRLRMRTRISQRAVIFIGGLVSAASFIPSHMTDQMWGVLCTSAVASLSVLFTSSAIYSILMPAQMKRAALSLRILSFCGIALFSYIAYTSTHSGKNEAAAEILLYIIPAVIAALSVIFIVFSSFPQGEKAAEPQPQVPALQPSLPSGEKPKKEKKEKPVKIKPEKKPKEKPVKEEKPKKEKKPKEPKEKKEKKEKKGNPEEPLSGAGATPSANGEPEFVIFPDPSPVSPSPPPSPAPEIPIDDMFIDMNQ